MATLTRTTSRPGLDRRSIAGWGVLSAIAVATAASWWQLLFLRLGDSHDGRIMGRFGLQVRNVWESGLVGSGFITDVTPFPTGTYAHHPPLANVLHVLVSSVIGEGEWQLRTIGFLSGAATVVALGFLLRSLDLDWPPVIGAVAATAATPMFWIYARLGLGFWLPVVLVALAARLRRQGTSARWLLVVGLLCALLSWEAIAIAGLTALWLLLSRPTAVAGRALLTAVGLGVVITVVWLLAATDLTELGAQAARRIQADGIDLAEFFRQQWFFYSNLYPWWYLGLMIPALVAGIAARGEIRWVTVAFTAVGIGFAAALPEAAYVHDYWTKILLVPFTVGLAVLVRGAGRWSSRAAPALAVVGLLLLGGWLLGGQRAEMEEAYFHAASDAGRVLASVEPAEAQETGWVIGAIALPRWMSWYWDLPVETLEADTVGLIDGDDLVLVRWDRLPAWYRPAERPPIVAEQGRYALVPARYLVPS